MGSGEVAHRYSIHSPERVVAVVTRGGDEPGTRYLHIDHIGSVNILTTDNGTAVDWRSYDPYGQRRNPVWGQPPPASFSSKSTKGFTGHESDDELGLVNMKGRLLDPKLGRFITTDPIVANLWDGQSFNAFSYVLGNPLSLVDPSGFAPEAPPLLPIRELHWTDAEGSLNVWLLYSSRVGVPPAVPTSQEAVDVGAAAPPVDVDTTGSPLGWGSGISLPLYELDSPSGPGTDDPFGIKAASLALGYAPPLTLMDQLVAGDPAGGRTTFLLPYEPGLFRDWDLMTSDNVFSVSVRPRLDGPPVDIREQAFERFVALGAITLGTVLTPGPADDLALGAGLSSAGGRGGTAGNSIVYRLIDEVGDPIYFGKTRLSELGDTLRRHANNPPGPWRGLQVVSGEVTEHQGLMLETSLIQDAIAQGRTIYNVAPRSISERIIQGLELPPMRQPTQTLLNPKLPPIGK